MKMKFIKFDYFTIHVVRSTGAVRSLASTYAHTHSTAIIESYVLQIAADQRGSRSVNPAALCVPANVSMGETPAHLCRHLLNSAERHIRATYIMYGSSRLELSLVGNSQAIGAASIVLAWTIAFGRKVHRHRHKWENIAHTSTFLRAEWVRKQGEKASNWSDFRRVFRPIREPKVRVKRWTHKKAVQNWISLSQCRVKTKWKPVCYWILSISKLHSQTQCAHNKILWVIIDFWCCWLAHRISTSIYVASSPPANNK